MTRVLVAGDSMVKYADQYFPSRRSLSVSVAAHRGIRIEHLLSMIADKLAGFDVVIVHVGTNNTVDSVSVCMDKYRQLAQGIIERNPMVHVAFSAILPRGQNQYSSWEAQSSWLHDLNGNYKRINSALMQYCHECGYTFLGGLVDNWPSCLSRDGVHPSRFGNKVLADFLYQGACTLSIHLERSRIQQSYKETQAPSSWTSWTRQDSIPAISEADFPPLGPLMYQLHAFTLPSSHQERLYLYLNITLLSKVENETCIFCCNGSANKRLIIHISFLAKLALCM
ncbi:uncharacterized protein [Dermacentor andersoni]|uniref:uncharacterized protein isoform X3 n=1 Tax=Dermacentor andersoni TaxID=34620 RepID=UPI002155EA3F|nr:uncharacterized protein LOC126526153 isoform X4 [Dermacentor andersoni]XP_050044676.1 uncharacterized protein LOC126541786 isoform X4 [Dermacentor andersoni]